MKLQHCLIVILLILLLSGTAFSKEPNLKADQALKLLLSGNKAFLSKTTPAILGTARADKPFAIIINCTDCRVPEELIFSQNPENIFSIDASDFQLREAEKKAIKYAINKFDIRLLLVLNSFKKPALVDEMHNISLKEDLKQFDNHQTKVVEVFLENNTNVVVFGL